MLKIKKNFRSRLLIRFDNRLLMQKKIAEVLNKLKISPKIKLTVDVDPISKIQVNLIKLYSCGTTSAYFIKNLTIKNDNK